MAFAPNFPFLYFYNPLWRSTYLRRIPYTVFLTYQPCSFNSGCHKNHRQDSVEFVKSSKGGCWILLFLYVFFTNTPTGPSRFNNHDFILPHKKPDCLIGNIPNSEIREFIYFIYLKEFDHHLFPRNFLRL